MMNVEIRDPRFHEVVDVSAELTQIATGFDFVEGPIWHPTFHGLMFSDIMGNSIYSWNAQTGVVKRNRHSYMANGNAYDQQGRIITCEHATSRLTRTDITAGTYEVLASHYNGKQLNSPNDVVVKSDGTIYFTDPLSGRSAGYGVPREPDLPHVGVYRLDPKSGELTLLDTDFTLPNGLCFSHDEQQLFVNDTRRFLIKVYDVQSDGALADGRVWAKTTGEGVGGPDGMKIDSHGNIYCTGQGGLHIFDPQGVCLGVILMPEMTANFVFGDTDFKSIYMTASTSIYKVRTKIAGWPTFQP